jgi:branched-chain amino acid transport system substrate-binding protein
MRHLVYVPISLIVASLAFAETKPILIGEVNTYSGPASVFSMPYRLGAEIALEEINATGGVLGRPLKFVFKDDQLNPVNARKVAQELVLNDKVDILMGGLNGATCQALSEIAKANSKFLMTTLCMIDPEDSHGVHSLIGRGTYSNVQVVGALAKRAVKEFPKAKKWLLIGANETSGKNIVSGFKRELKKLKKDVVFVNELYPQFGTTDYSSQITAIAASRADAVFSGLWGGDSITFTKQAKAFKLFSKMKFVSYSIGTSEESFAIGMDNAEGAISMGIPWYDPAFQKINPNVMTFVGKFMKLSNNQPPGGAPFMGYQAMYVLAEAIKKANSVEGEKLGAAMGAGFDITIPWGKVNVRGCDRVAYFPVNTGLVSPSVPDKKMSFLGNVETYNGIDFARPCSDVTKSGK